MLSASERAIKGGKEVTACFCRAEAPGRGVARASGCARGASLPWLPGGHAGRCQPPAPRPAFPQLGRPHRLGLFRGAGPAPVSLSSWLLLAWKMLLPTFIEY